MKYLLLSSRRSGSALLKHSLMALFSENNDGPDEWIVSPITRKNLGLPKDFSEAKKLVLNKPQLLVDRMSTNSHRKVMYSQLLTPNNLPTNVPIIHLIRRDSWKQAKSSWIMDQKKLPAHIGGEEYKQLLTKNLVFKLDLKAIEKTAKKMLLQKHIWYQALKNRPLTLTLFYEEDLYDIDIFKNQTIPRIEAFLNKKQTIENFNFPLEKTSSIYTIENTEEYDENDFIKKFYFDANNIKISDYIKIRLKRVFSWTQLKNYVKIKNCFKKCELH